MAGRGHSKGKAPRAARQNLQSRAQQLRQLCRERWQLLVDDGGLKCAQTRGNSKIAPEFRARLDCRAAMLQAIRVGREIPMLEPWIIDEIRRREEERRRGDLPRLEIPMPQPLWPEEGESDPNRQGDKNPERGVVIIGM